MIDRAERSIGVADRNQAYIAHMAGELGCSVEALRAVLEVESRGEGIVGGHPVIRLEVNHLWSLCSEGERRLVDARFHVFGPEVWEGHTFRRVPEGALIPLHQPGPGGQAIEWEAYSYAVKINPLAAIEATSWGLGQVMGEGWQELGFQSPNAFVAEQMSEIGQLHTFHLFLQFHGLDVWLQRRDWRSFARVYNGAGKVEQYARDLAEAYDRITAHP